MSQLVHLYLTLMHACAILAQVCLAHRAARLWKHLEWTSQAVTAYKQWQDEEAVKVRGANAVQQTTTAAPSGDMVRMRETVDVTKVRGVPMMESRDWEKASTFSID